MCNQSKDSNHGHVRAVQSRREALVAGAAALIAAPFLGGVTSIVQAAQAANAGLPVGRPAHAQVGKVRGAATEWLSYGGDKASSKYSPLAQIGRDNFNRLRVAWTWRSADEKGTPVKAVAQVSKQGFVYVFDRVTGRPIWPIEERPVPQSSVPGEKSSQTQPFPTKPAPFDRQGVTENDVIDFTPELRKEALAVLAKYNYGPLYTPPSIEKPTIELPGWAGGASWAGAACDPETGMMYVPSITSPLTISMVKPGALSPAPYLGVPRPMETLQGVPLWKPPYGRITAIDLNTGDHRWMVPMGDLAHPRLKPLGLPPVGRATRGHALLTKTLLIVGQEGTTQRAEGGSPAAPGFEVHDPTLRAYDKATGKLVGEVVLPRNATAAPMTYMLNGKQFIVVATGGSNLPAELIASRLP